MFVCFVFFMFEKLKNACALSTLATAKYTEYRFRLYQRRLKLSVKGTWKLKI